MKNNYTDEKEFSVALRKLDGSPANFFSKEISKEILIKSRQNRRKKKYDKCSVVDTFMVLGIQDLTQLNPRFTDISNSPPYTNFVDKYPSEKFMYRFRLTSVTISTSMENMDTEILVTCTGLNNCKKADINGTREDILATIHTENIVNWAHLKNTSSWINIDLADYLNIQEPANTSFIFLTESIHNISKFDMSLKNKNRELIRFGESEQKIPQFNFAIDAINT